MGPVRVKPVSNVTTIAGHPFTLACPFTGYPVRDVHFLKGKKFCYQHVSSSLSSFGNDSKKVILFQEPSSCIFVMWSSSTFFVLSQTFSSVSFLVHNYHFLFLYLLGILLLQLPFFRLLYSILKHTFLFPLFPCVFESWYLLLSVEHELMTWNWGEKFYRRVSFPFFRHSRRSDIFISFLSSVFLSLPLTLFSFWKVVLYSYLSS